MRQLGSILAAVAVAAVVLGALAHFPAGAASQRGRLAAIGAVAGAAASSTGGGPQAAAPTPPTPLDEPTDAAPPGWSVPAAAWESLLVLDVAEPAAVQVLGRSEPLPGLVQGVALADRYAYVATYGAGLVVLNLADPTQPAVVGGMATPAHLNGVVVADGYAYAAAGWDGLRVFDVADPTRVVAVGSYHMGSMARGVALQGHYLYVLESPRSLAIVDVTNPRQPREIGVTAIPFRPRDVALEGPYAYLAAGPEGVQVVDVGNPAAPRKVGIYAPLASAMALGVVDGYLYLLDAAGALHILDLSAPTAPLAMESLPLPEPVQALTIARARLSRGHRLQAADPRPGRRRAPGGGPLLHRGARRPHGRRGRPVRVRRSPVDRRLAGLRAGLPLPVEVALPARPRRPRPWACPSVPLTPRPLLSLCRAVSLS